MTTAYGRLSAEGYLDGMRGGGTVVSDLFQHKDPAIFKTGGCDGAKPAYHCAPETPGLVLAASALASRAEARS